MIARSHYSHYCCRRRYLENRVEAVGFAQWSNCECNVSPGQQPSSSMQHASKDVVCVSGRGFFDQHP